MFHATIHEDDPKPFCIAGHVTPYDLELLRDHLIARLRTTLRVEVRLPATDHPLVDRALRPAARRGVTVTVVDC